MPGGMNYWREICWYCYPRIIVARTLSLLTIKLWLDSVSNALSSCSSVFYYEGLCWVRFIKITFPVGLVTIFNYMSSLTKSALCFRDEDVIYRTLHSKFKNFERINALLISMFSKSNCIHPTLHSAFLALNLAHFKLRNI